MPLAINHQWILPSTIIHWDDNISPTFRTSGTISSSTTAFTTFTTHATHCSPLFKCSAQTNPGWQPHVQLLHSAAVTSEWNVDQHLFQTTALDYLWRMRTNCLRVRQRLFVRYNPKTQYRTSETMYPLSSLATCFLVIGMKASLVYSLRKFCCC